MVRSQAGPKGRQLDVGARWAPRLLVANISDFKKSAKHIKEKTQTSQANKQTDVKTSKRTSFHPYYGFRIAFALKPVLILSPFPRDLITGSPQVVPAWPVPPLQTSNKTDKESSHLRVIWNRQWPIQRSVGSVMMTTCLIYLNSSCIPLICFIDSRQLKLGDVIKVNYLWYQGHQSESLLIHFIRGV